MKRLIIIFLLIEFFTFFSWKGSLHSIIFSIKFIKVQVIIIFISLVFCHWWRTKFQLEWYFRNLIEKFLNDYQKCFQILAYPILVLPYLILYYRMNRIFGSQWAIFAKTGFILWSNSGVFSKCLHYLLLVLQ